MATFQQHLNDMRWLFQEKGLLQVHSWFAQVASLPANGTLVTIGALEMDAAATPGFTSAVPANTVKPSGNLNLVTSTKLEYGSGVTPVSKEVVPGSTTTR